MKYLITIMYVMSSCTFFLSCKKDSFLASKPNNSLLVPKTVSDYQLVLDNDFVMNGSSAGITPELLETGEYNYYISATVYPSLYQLAKDAYIWADKSYPAQTLNSWNAPYSCVYYSNFVLDGLSNVSVGNSPTAWLNAKGSALFYRSHAFYQLAQAFAPAYDSNTSKTDFGIPLRLTADVNEKIERTTVLQTYDMVLKDLKESALLLPTVQLTYLNRPSQCACFALLARVYLAMRVYDSAASYATAALKLQNTLMDYNSYSAGQFHFPRFSPEVIFHSITQFGADYFGNIDSAFYSSFDSSDLRKTYFFNLNNTNSKFIGSYDGSSRLFGGLATDELYLIRAECAARNGNISAALVDLNALVSKRFKTGKFIPYTAVDAKDALAKILTERRKELCFRGLRWTDMRRLNKENAAITVQRTANGQAYSLTPNSLKWVWPIPDDVISFNPAMQQNPR